MMIISTLFVMVNLQGRAQEKFSLGYKLEKGKTYKYVQDNNVESTQEMGGQEMKMNASVHLIMKYEVEEVSKEGSITLVSSYDEAKVQMKGMGRDTTMDMKNMTGKKTTNEIAKNGKTIKEISKDTAKHSRSLMSLDGFTYTKFVVLPEMPVGIGEKWTKTASDTNKSDEGQIVYKRNTEYTLVGKEKKGNHECLKIDLKGTVEVTGTMKQMSMDMVMEGNGDSSGTFWFDPASGLMIEQQNISSLEMTLALIGQSQMTIPISQKVTTTEKILE